MNYGVDEKCGFTLPEVCVALAVLLAGVTGLLGCWNFFNREVADEHYRLERFYDVLSAMESLIAERPSCADSLVLIGPPMADVVTEGSMPMSARFAVQLHRSVTVRLERVPGAARLAWAVAEQDGFSLKRMVRCLGGALDEQ